MKRGKRNAQKRIEICPQQPPAKLPSATQLAQIAAGFGADCDPETAVKRAASLFLRAARFVNEHRKSTAADLASACGDRELAARLREADFLLPLQETYRFEPAKRDDEARRFLAEGGLLLRNGRAVMGNLRRWHRVSGARRCIIDNTSLALSDAEVERLAKSQGWNPEEEEDAWKLFLEEHRERRADKRKVYLVPLPFLNGLVLWKKALKRAGGHKSRPTAAAPQAEQSQRGS